MHDELEMVSGSRGRAAGCGWINVGILLALACVAAVVASADDVDPRNAELQRHALEFKEIPLARSRPGMQFTAVTLNEKPIRIGTNRYDGFRFHTGSATGVFYSAIAFPSEELFEEWYILPATGQMERGYVDVGDYTEMINLPALEGGKAMIIMQELPAGALKTNATYFVWLRFVNDQPVKLPVSAAIIGGEMLPYRDRYPAYRPHADPGASSDAAP